MTTPGEDAPGLQAERTVLAHWRTDLTALAVGLLVVRQATPGAERVGVLVLTSVSVVLVTTAGLLRQRGLLAGHLAAPHGTSAAITLAITIMQVAALAVVL